MLISFGQGLLKKHEAFETDFQVHRDRCTEIKKEGQRLIDEVTLPPLFHAVITFCVESKGGCGRCMPKKYTLGEFVDFQFCFTGTKVDGIHD